ncbi:MAG: AarF/ABC1/UbiB kinase family protein [Salibacteraceae bacterium]
MGKKNQDKIAVSKIGRAGKLANTGAKIGGNYMKYYAKKLVNKSIDRDELDEANAKDAFSAFSELKGGPLKMAQMLSLGDQLLPKAYTMQFAQAQNQVTPLSYPLIQKTFKNAVGSSTDEIFDHFSKQAVNAASIGQVHKGRIGNEDYAVKIQYPGVADSLLSDMAMITPFATRMFNMNKDQIAPYLKEVKSKLLEETDYKQEIENANHIIEGCAGLSNLCFPKFKPELSGDRVITMSWIEGLGLADWIKTAPSQEERNLIGQSLWDFYHHQIHEMHFMHADPHPGNFIITPENKLGVIDFGCIKSFPEDFYQSYLQLISHGQQPNPKTFILALIDLGMFDPNAPENERILVLNTFKEMFSLVGKPLWQERFDFGDDAFFKTIYTQGEALSKNPDLQRLSTRGSEHFIYFNRTYFGLYQLLNQLKAEVNTKWVGGTVAPLKKSA